MLFRHWRATSFVIVSALILASGAHAQSDGSSIGSSAVNRAWIAGGLGGGSGVVLQWEVWAAHGPLVLGYQDSRADNIAGTTRNEQAFLGGARLPWHSLSLLLAAGVGSASKCVSNGEQSGTCTRSRDSGIPVITVAAGWAFSSWVGLHASYLQPTRGSSGFAAYVVGLEVGKLR